jgi:hypothetical protein
MERSDRFGLGACDGLSRGVTAAIASVVDVAMTSTCLASQISRSVRRLSECCDGPAEVKSGLGTSILRALVTGLDARVDVVSDQHPTIVIVTRPAPMATARAA